MRTFDHFLMVLTIASIAVCNAAESPATAAYEDLEAVRTAEAFDASKVYRLSTSGVCGLVKDDHILVTEVLPNTPATGKILVGDKVRAFQYRGLGGGIDGVRKTAGKRLFRLGRDWDWHLYLTVERASLRDGKGNRITFDLRVPRPTDNQYHFGPTGFFGNIHAGYIEVSHVVQGSPADGRLTVGDHIIGVSGQRLEGNVFRLFTKSVDEAEREASNGILPIKFRRHTKDRTRSIELDVNLQLNVLGSYAETTPIDCPKTDAIIDRTADGIIKRGKYGKLNTSLLALLATGEKKHIEHVGNVLKKAKWAQPDVETNFGKGMVSWNYSYQTITMCEYYLLTKDEFVIPAIKAYANQIARGQDAAGLWNHRMANPAANFGKLHGRLYGYAAINQTSVALWIALILAKECGVNDPEVDAAIDKTYKHYTYWIDRGKLPYGNHGAGVDFFTNNGTSGSAAVGFALLNDLKGARFFSQLSAAAADEILTGHTGPWFNKFWSGIGANVSGPEATKAYNDKTHWLRTVSRTWDSRFLHMEARDCKPGNHGLGSSGSYLLNLSAGRRALRITGRGMDESIWLNAEEAKAVVDAGSIDYNQKSVDELIVLLGHDLPPVRFRAAGMLAIKDADISDKIMTLLANGTRNQRIGAIHATRSLKIDDAHDELMVVVNNTKDDLWIRQLALRTLTDLDGCKVYAPKVLDLLLTTKTYDFHERFDQDLGQALVKMTDSDPYAAGLDKDKLYVAVHKLLDSKRQNARGAGMALIKKVTLEELYRVVDKMIYVIEDKDRTYVSYHGDGHRQMGLDILYNLNIDESLDLTVNTINEPVGRGWRARNRKKMMKTFGGEAKRIIPRIKEVLGKQADEFVKIIEEAETTRNMIPLEKAKALGKQ